MSLARKILSNTLWQVIGRIVTALLGIISIKILTGYLPSEVYGQYATLYEFIGFFAIAADFGLYTIGIREMAKEQKPAHEILGNILSLRLILIFIFLSLAVLVVQLIPQYQNSFVQKGMIIVACTTGLTLLSGTLTSILQFKLKMLYANICLIISRIINIAYIAYTIFFLHPENLDQGFTHLLYSGILANGALLLLTFYFVSKETYIKPIFETKYIKEILVKSFPYGISLILSTIYFKIDIILLSLMKGYHQVGIYGVPLKLMEILSVIPTFFMNSSLPSLTQKFQTNKVAFSEAINRSWNFLLLLATPILIGGIILAFPLTFAISSPQFLSGYHCTNNIQVVYQSASEASTRCDETEFKEGFNWKNSTTNNVYFVGSDVALKLILVGMFFSYLNTLFAFSLVASDKQSKLLIINFFGVVFNIVTNLIFIPVYGFIGAAITTAISELIILTGTYLYLKKNVTLNLPIINSLKIIASGLIMGFVVFIFQKPTYNFLENFNIFLLIPLGAMVYLATLHLLKALPYDEIKRILKKT
jgi:O-antigen/teichoic acid export membrane protein